jgi:hypothetical protein
LFPHTAGSNRSSDEVLIDAKPLGIELKSSETKVGPTMLLWQEVDGWNRDVEIVFGLATLHDFRAVVCSGSTLPTVIQAAMLA